MGSMATSSRLSPRPRYPASCSISFAVSASMPLFGTAMRSMVGTSLVLGIANRGWMRGPGGCTGATARAAQRPCDSSRAR
ncbi:hypothetical protein ACFPRL_01580 [Pseudoclavibacter helvolus]